MLFLLTLQYHDLSHHHARFTINRASMKDLILVLLKIFCTISCTERPIDIPTDSGGNNAWTGLPQLDDLVIYEVNFRAFSQEGTIQGLIAHPPGTTWTDVADLNFDNRIMRDSMMTSMKW